MRRIYESITDCLQDYGNTVSRTKSLKITFDNILSDQEHAEQFKIRINQIMLLPHHFDMDFFYAGKRKDGIRILSMYGFTKLNRENIFDYNSNDLKRINERNQNPEKFVETETKILNDLPCYTSPLLNREDLIHIVEHDPRTCKLFGEHYHYFGEVFLRPKVAEMQIDNIGMLMLLDYGLDCLVKGGKFCLQTVVGRLLDYNGKLKEEEIKRVFGFFFTDEEAVFEWQKSMKIDLV